MPFFGRKSFGGGGDGEPGKQVKESSNLTPTRDLNRQPLQDSRPAGQNNGGGLAEGGGTRPLDLSPFQGTTNNRPGYPADNQNKTDPKTKIFRPQGAAEQVSPGIAARTSSRRDPIEDPVVGWVVVVDGPGKGASRPLGYGMNAIGRIAESRVCLDFGDENISRTNHALLSYDARGKRFFIQHGGSVNLTYVNDQPVLTPMELKGGEVILLGCTKLCFIPFCGPEFDWQDAP